MSPIIDNRTQILGLFSKLHLTKARLCIIIKRLFKVDVLQQPHTRGSLLSYYEGPSPQGGKYIMTNVINNYETIFVIDASLPEEQITAISDKFKAMIEANGTVESVDVWGKRRLAYAIDYKTEGYYVLINFASQAEFVAELERVYNITDGLLRTIVIRK